MDREWTQQAQDLIFALDIGTRSVIGVVGRPEDGLFHVLATEREEHSKRAMLDGQIEDIAQVALVAGRVKERLEQRLECRLKRVCIAAAGRALQTEQGRYVITLPETQRVNDEMIARLEAGAVSEAETAVDSADRLFLVGYTVSRYLLDDYPLSTLKGHNGQKLEAEVVATFLPAGVVESLYAVMEGCGLEVSSLTLEPIAAINAAIPMDLRLLNLAMIDIGAGTSDIALCRDGSVVGYTMATVAGDEITEAIMRTYLVDFQTAEQIKAHLSGSVTFTDILGLEQTLDARSICENIRPAVTALAKELAERICCINGGSAPSAVFLAGGGSKLAGLPEETAAALGIEARRVAIAGGYFKNVIRAEDESIFDPVYATPLGIAASAGLGLISDSYRLQLNGRRARLFRSGLMSALDVLMMNGYTYADLIGRTGRSLMIYADGVRKVFYGEPAVPSVLKINGADASPSTVIQSGDSIEFTPAVSGADASLTLGQLLRALDMAAPAAVNGERAEEDTLLQSGDRITSGLALLAEEAEEPTEEWVEEPAETWEGETRFAPRPDEMPEPDKEEAPMDWHFTLNDRPLTLPGKRGGEPYYLMDLLEHTDIDFDHLQSPVMIQVNGANGQFSQTLAEGDRVRIYLAARQISGDFS